MHWRMHIGERAGVRTQDLPVKSRPLYRLSYALSEIFHRSARLPIVCESMRMVNLKMVSVYIFICWLGYLFDDVANVYVANNFFERVFHNTIATIFRWNIRCEKQFWWLLRWCQHIDVFMFKNIKPIFYVEIWGVSPLVNMNSLSNYAIFWLLEEEKHCADHWSALWAASSLKIYRKILRFVI